MYEIWLMLNIIWEIALGLWPVMLAAVVVWLVVVGAAWRQDRSHWRATIWPALAVGAAAAVAAALLVPGWTHSALSNMGYWIDWVVLLAFAAAAGTVVAAFAWPLLTRYSGRARG